MMERHAQVGEDTIDMIGSVETQEIAQKTEVAVDKREARIVDRVGYGVGVLIEAQQTGTNIMVSAVRAQGYARYW